MKTINKKTSRVSYTSSEYDKFSFIDSNRDLNTPPVIRKIRDLKDDFLNGRNFTDSAPIIVNSKYEIMDGQARFVACKDLGLPIHFYINDKFKEKDIPGFNQNHGVWKMADYGKAYATQGKKPYIEIRRLIKEYNLKHSHFTDAMSHGGGRNTTGAFKNGTVTMDQVKHAEKVLKMVLDFLPEFKYAKNRRFIAAIRVISSHPEYSHKRMMEKFKRQTKRLLRHPSRDMFIENLEEIYNNRCGKKQRVKFLEN